MDTIRSPDLGLIQVNSQDEACCGISKMLLRKGKRWCRLMIQNKEPVRKLPVNVATVPVRESAEENIRWLCEGMTEVVNCSV